MNFDEPITVGTRATVIRGDETYEFEPGVRIPTWLVTEGNAALLEGRADVRFVPPTSTEGRQP